EVLALRKAPLPDGRRVVRQLDRRVDPRGMRVIREVGPLARGQPGAAVDHQAPPLLRQVVEATISLREQVEGRSREAEDQRAHEEAGQPAMAPRSLRRRWGRGRRLLLDRKSTRLNSSHVKSSY